jgi:uncharacterized protein YjbI with pentapeptide repeats
MDDCAVACAGGALQAGDLAKFVGQCEHDTLTVSACSVDSAALALLRGGAHPDLHLTLSSVTGTIDLQGARLRDLVVVASSIAEVDLHDATLDRVRIAPSMDPTPDAYSKDAVAPGRVHVSTVNARGCHATNFALLASDVDNVDLRHAQVDDTLDLTWTQAASVSLRFADVLRLEGARLTVNKGLDMFGARASQASLSWADLQAVNAETASVDRVLSLSNTVIRNDLDGYWFSAGAIVFNGTRVASMDLSYAHLGLLDVDSALGFESGPVKATGLRVDSIGGDVQVLTRRIVRNADSEGAFHSIETALRNGGRYAEANTVAFEGSPLTAGVAAKLPGSLAVVVIALLVLCCWAAAWCCRAVSNDKLRPWRVFLCALDIVLPSFVDIGALSAWTDYDDTAKKDAEVKIEGERRTIAFIIRIVGTMAFTYLLLYVTNLRG